MRILRVYPTLPPHAGGVEQHVARLSEAQRTEGSDVVVLYNFGAPTHASDLRIAQGLNLYRIKPQFIRNVVFYLLATIRIIRMRRTFDVVHVHGDWSAFICGTLLAKVIGARARIASVHDRLRKGRGWDFLYSSVLRGYDFCYSTGQLDAKRLTRLMRKQTTWITSGLHPIFQEPPSSVAPEISASSCEVLTVASLTARKRLDLVLQIAKILPCTRFRIIGDGPERPSLEAAIRREGLGNVVLAGRLSVEQVRNGYLHTKLFLLTSTSEGTPTAVLEAMACGLPIVISASNDFSDLLEDGQTGFVIKSSDAKEYAASITMLLQQEDLRAHMGGINREKALAFSWPTVAATISRAMERTLENHSDTLSSVARAQ